MITGEGRESLETLAAGGHAPRRLFIKKRVWLGEEIARRFGKPEGELVEEREGVVGAVGEEQDRLVEVRVEAGEDRQARGTRQAEGTRGEMFQ